MTHVTAELALSAYAPRPKMVVIIASCCEEDDNGWTSQLLPGHAARHAASIWVEAGQLVKQIFRGHQAGRGK